MTSAIIFSIGLDHILTGCLLRQNPVGREGTDLNRSDKWRESWSLRSAVFNQSSCLFGDSSDFIFLFIYLTNYIKLYWVPMACTKMKKIMSLSFRRSQSVGENHHGTMDVVHSVWIKYPRTNVHTPFPQWGQRVLYSFACFIKFYVSDK